MVNGGVEDMKPLRGGFQGLGLAESKMRHGQEVEGEGLLG